MTVIAALYVDPGGCYSALPGIELWDKSRDARTYCGPHPVVAHPPCATWCRLAGLVEARWGKKRGEDGGCFEAALKAVRRWGGVLEHPAFSDAFKRFGLPSPPYTGWQATICGGWVCYVEQGRYGHLAKKATWLYAHGIEKPPPMHWGWRRDSNADMALVSWCGNHTKANDQRPRVGKKAAAATPPAFRDALLEIARSALVPCGTYPTPPRH